MKATMVVVGLWICSALNTWTSTAVEVVAPPGQVTTLVVSESTSKDEYSNFLKSVRDNLKATVGRSTCHGLPMASGKAGFMAVYLEFASPKKVIKLALKQSDGYLAGYADKYDGKCRYRIFETFTPDALKTFLCNGEEQPTEKGVNIIPYAESYNAIKGETGADRSKVGLGMKRLEDQMNNIYGKSENKDKGYKRNEGTFLLLAIQMVSEAARFKYIENKIKAIIKIEYLPGEYISGEYVPDERALSLENNWGKLSEKIAIQESSSAPFDMPEKMKDENGKDWKSDTVDNLKSNYISLLKNVSNCKGPSLSFYFFNYDHPLSMIAMSELDTL